VEVAKLSQPRTRTVVPKFQRIPVMMRDNTPTNILDSGLNAWYADCGEPGDQAIGGGLLSNVNEWNLGISRANPNAFGLLDMMGKGFETLSGLGFVQLVSNTATVIGNKPPTQAAVFHEFGELAPLRQIAFCLLDAERYGISAARSLARALRPSESRWKEISKKFKRVDFRILLPLSFTRGVERQHFGDSRHELTRVTLG
jgi:hypothetical protein